MNWEIAIIKPVDEFLESRSLKERAKIKEVFNLFEEFGLFLGGPYLKRVAGTEDLWELRVKNIRLLFFVKNTQAVIVHGFVKKTRRTPKKDLELAKKRRKLVEGG